MSDQEWPSAPGGDEPTPPPSEQPPDATPSAPPAGGATPPPGTTPPPPPPSSPPPAPGGYDAPATSGTGANALVMRFLARLIDGLIVGITMVVLFAVLPGLSVGGPVYQLVAAVAGFGYFVWFESNSGATPGKSMLKLHVTSEGGGPVTIDQSARRNWWLLLGALGGVPVLGPLAGLVSLVIAIAIAVTISNDPRGQGFHDHMANAMVAPSA